MSTIWVKTKDIFLRNLVYEYPQRHKMSLKERPEMPYVCLTWLDRCFRFIYFRMIWLVCGFFVSRRSQVEAIVELSDSFTQLTDVDLRHELTSLRDELRLSGIHDKNVIRSFALVREVSGRVLGMRHHHTQIKASLLLLQGLVAEMATGEGKTLAGTLAVSTAAMAGIPVHVVTTNDYLAQRDCEEMTPLYEFLGLRSSFIVNEHSIDERKDIYSGDIVYCSNNELVFDYLKDLLVLGDSKHTVDCHKKILVGRDEFLNQLMHRGLAFAVVDEVDSVLIDESRTPLVISGGEQNIPEEEAFLTSVMVFAEKFELDLHFNVDLKLHRITFTPEGVDLVETMPLDEGMPWHNLVRRQQILLQALTALYLFHRDENYIVIDEKIVIVDEYTGRPAPDRSWEGGLHQLIEIKELCPITAPRQTLAKISYQSFFKKYFYLSGMTGTAKEVSAELYRVYDLKVRKVTQLKPSLREVLKCKVLVSQEEKEREIVACAEEISSSGRSVLIGTASVKQSENLSNQLQKKGLCYELLSAKQDADEAKVISGAGQKGAITIATSMAGRGTDIKLSEVCRNAGGLHVIICELNDAARVDRQLSGRCARQGDPGSVEYILSFDDPLIHSYGRWISQLICRLFVKSPKLLNFLGARLQRYCQWQLERKHARERNATMKSDDSERNSLAFLGDGQ